MIGGVVITDVWLSIWVECQGIVLPHVPVCIYCIDVPTAEIMLVGIYQVFIQAVIIADMRSASAVHYNG